MRTNFTKTISILIMLSVITGITFLTNCTKQEIVQEEEQTNNYWYPTTKDIVITDIPLSQLADSVEKYNTLQEYTNYIIEGYVIMDTVKYTSLVFNPNDYVTFNDEATGIEELKSTVTGKANIKFIETDTISNTLHLGSAFNYDGQGGLNPEINEILAENPIPVDTFHWETAKFTENFGINFDINSDETVIDISGALLTASETQEFYDAYKNDNGMTELEVLTPTELAIIKGGDTLSWDVATKMLNYDENTAYTTSVAGNIGFIKSPFYEGYPEPVIEAILNIPSINHSAPTEFTYSNGPGIPTYLYRD